MKTMPKVKSRVKEASMGQIENETEEAGDSSIVAHPELDEDRRREKLLLLIKDAEQKMAEQKRKMEGEAAIIVSAVERLFDLELMRCPTDILNMNFNDYLKQLGSGLSAPSLDSAALEAECEAVVSKTPGRKKRGRPRRAAAAATATIIEEETNVLSAPQVVRQSTRKRVQISRMALQERQDSNFITPAVPTRFAKQTVAETPYNPIPDLTAATVIIPKFDLRTPGTASKRLPQPGEIFVSLRGSPVQTAIPEETEIMIPVGGNKAIKVVTMPSTSKKVAEPSAHVQEIYKSIMSLKRSAHSST